MSSQIVRGEIHYADLTGNNWSEQGGCRPVLIIQNDVGNRHSPTTIVAPLTSNVKKKLLPTHVYIHAEDCNLDRDSIVMLEQVRAIDKNRLRGYVSYLDDFTMNEIDHALSVSFGLAPSRVSSSPRMAPAMAV